MAPLFSSSIQNPLSNFNASSFMSGGQTQPTAPPAPAQQSNPGLLSQFGSFLGGLGSSIGSAVTQPFKEAGLGGYDPLGLQGKPSTGIWGGTPQSVIASAAYGGMDPSKISTYNPSNSPTSSISAATGNERSTPPSLASQFGNALGGGYVNAFNDVGRTLNLPRRDSGMGLFPSTPTANAQNSSFDLRSPSAYGNAPTPYQGQGTSNRGAGYYDPNKLASQGGGIPGLPEGYKGAFRTVYTKYGSYNVPVEPGKLEGIKDVPGGVIRPDTGDVVKGNLGTPSPFVGQSGLYGQVLNELWNRVNRGQMNFTEANEKLRKFQEANAEKIAAIQGDPNLSIDTQQGKAQVANTQFASALPAYQGAVQNALAERGQDLSTLQSIAGGTAPTTQFGVLTDPVTGQPIMGGNPASAAFAGGQIQGAQTLGQNSAAIGANLNAANNLTNQFNAMLQTTAAQQGFNPSDITISNKIIGFVRKGLSDPTYPQLSSTFLSAVNQYRGIVGNATVDSILDNAQASGATLSAVLSSLQSQGQAVVQGMGQGSAGQSPYSQTITGYGTGGNAISSPTGGGSNYGW